MKEQKELTFIQKLEKGNKRIGREVEEFDYNTIELDEVLDSRKPFREVARAFGEALFALTMLTGPAHAYGYTHKEELQALTEQRRLESGIVFEDKGFCEKIEMDHIANDVIRPVVKPVAEYFDQCKPKEIQVAKVVFEYK